MPAVPLITSLQNERIKGVIKLRQRSHRDNTGLIIIEGYREITRSLDNNIPIRTIFFCSEMFLGKNDLPLVERCIAQGAEAIPCSLKVFEKIAYRDRPEGLLAIAPHIRKKITDIVIPPIPLLVVAESIEKPGNLGTILRTSDASGVDAVIVCDKCTDTGNPNVVRASIGTIFSVPLAEASSAETIEWLKAGNINIISASPHAEKIYTDIDLTKPSAIVLGAEQYGLSEAWIQNATTAVKIPMLGQADSLNVAAAATILLYEAARQRGFKTDRVARL